MKVIELAPSVERSGTNNDRAAMTGLIALIAATTMLMAALSSAYIVRRGLSNDWVPLQLPPVLASSAILLLVSSVALEIGRRSFGARRTSHFARLWFAAPALGVCFVMAQAYGWNQIHQAGISAASSPSAAFIYVLSGIVVALVMGTAIALVWIGIGARGSNVQASGTRLKVAAYYWHYLGCFWIYLLILFYTRS
jgi:cytochrome c oxidase subunit 3